MNTLLNDLTKKLLEVCADSQLDPQNICEALQSCYSTMNADNPHRLIDYDYAGLRVDIESMNATLNGSRIALTSAEWKILTALIRSGGRKVTKADLRAIVYGEGEPKSNTLEVFLSHLRKKIGRDLVATFRGQGYTMASMI